MIILLFLLIYSICSWFHVQEHVEDWIGLRYCTNMPLLLFSLPLYSSQPGPLLFPVGYMDQPTGLLHIHLWGRLCGRQGEEVIQITS